MKLAIADTTDFAYDSNVFDTYLAFTSTNVTSFIIDGDRATLQGSGLANGVAVSNTIQVVDGRDAITITLSNGYTATGELRNGRIVIRHNCG
jgi:hypothetical protein